MIFSHDNDGDDASTTVATKPPARSPRRITRGSDQQEAFWDELLTGTSNVLLEARAGTGKSSSCREAMSRLLEKDPTRRIFYCCFNKKVSEEFALSAPFRSCVDTMHGLGLAALRRGFDNVDVRSDKSYFLLDVIGGAGLKGYIRRAIVKLVSLAKNDGLRPTDNDLDVKLFDLVERHDIECYRQDDQVVQYAIDVLEHSGELTSMVDFDDMLWLPVLFDLAFPAVDDLFIDECQDLNPVQHQLAILMAQGARTTIVGDPFQAIYAWRGASVNSIDDMQGLLAAKRLPLTVSWRCPKSHARLAAEIVRDFEAAPDAIEGQIVTGDSMLIDQCQPGDLVLCRSNAPLVSNCLRLISQNKRASMRGRAIGEQLQKVRAKADRGESRTLAEFRKAVHAWKNKEVARLKEKEGTEQLVEQVNDQAACLEAITLSVSSPSEISSRISLLFSDDDDSSRVTFSSVHRAKGSEAKRVTYLQVPYAEQRDRAKPSPPWEHQQRRNLRYVALTRSMEVLTLCV